MTCYSKILKKRGIDKRCFRWFKQKFKYGFDEREMWNFDITILQFIYPRLRYFRDHCISQCGNIMININGKNISQAQAINMTLEEMEEYLKSDTMDSPKSGLEILAQLLPTLWT